MLTSQFRGPPHLWCTMAGDSGALRLPGFPGRFAAPDARLAVAVVLWLDRPHSH